jgi:dipeptidyl-peptidase 4
VRTLLACLLLTTLAAAQQVPTTTGKSALGEEQHLTIERMLQPGGITGRGPDSFEWSPDNSKLAFVQRNDTGEQGQLWYIDLTNGNKAVLVSQEKLATLSPDVNKIQNEREKERITRYGVAAYYWAPDSKHLLFDSYAQLWLYDLNNGTAVQVTSATDPSGDPKFSPDGKLLSYVRKGNLYVRPLDGKKNERALTKDGSDDLLNGDVDWVYEEELDVRSNYFWSPNGKQIVYLQMNEKQVPAYPIEDFIPHHPTIDQQKYPQAGDPNPAVRLGVVDADGGSTKWFTLGDDPDVYIPRFGWVRDGLLYAEVLNRAQDKLALFFIDTKTGKSRVMLIEQSDAWVEVNNDFKILPSGNQFLWGSWRDGFTHLYLYSFDLNDPFGSDAKLERQITKGEWEVAELEGVDTSGKTIYFSANKDDSRELHLFSINLDGTHLTPLTAAPGWHSVSMSPDTRHFTDTSSTVTSPPVFSLCATGGPCSTIWKSKDITAYHIIPPKFVDFKAEDGTVLHGLIVIPPEASPTNKVPLVMNPYGGPQVGALVNRWGNGLFADIFAQNGMATLIVDNRGMGGRGKKFTQVIKHHFGETELKDQLASLDQALAEFPQLDSMRLGWWGWSYGGYMTLYALTHSDRFKAGVAGGPVTNWTDYDTIYTERYMGLPKDNPSGYKNSSPVNSAANLHGDILLIHGTGDDNVHLQNTIQMIQALVAAQKPYTLVVYPRMTHGVTGPARAHLNHTIVDYFRKELLGR